MTIEDLRGKWKCAWCDDAQVTKRGTICPACQLKLDHHRHEAPGAPQLLQEPAHPVRGWHDVIDPEGRV